MYILVDSIKETKPEERFVSLTEYCNKEYLHFRYFIHFFILFIFRVFFHS